MATQAQKFARTDKDVAGLQVYGDYAGAADDPARVQVLIDMIKPQQVTLPTRGNLDQISPAAQVQLLAELVALKAAVS